MTDGQGHGRTGQPELPAGVRERQAWRPPMLATLDAFLVGVERRSESFLLNVGKLVAWHEQLARRAEPWGVGHPLALPLQAEVPAAGLPLARPPGGIPPGVPDSPGAWASGESGSTAPTERPIRPRSTAPNGVSPPRSRSPVTPGRTAARRSAGYDLSSSRPSIRLASLRHPSGGPDRAADRPASGRPGDQPRAARDVIEQALKAADRPPLRSGPVLAASPSPRQEVRGGFPARPETVGPASTGARAQPADSTSVVPMTAPRYPPARPGVDGVAMGAPLPPDPRAPASPPSALPPVPSTGVTDARGIVEQLIERTLLPVPLPGLEVRLVPPEQRITSEARVPSDAPEPPAPEESRPEAAAAPPALNIDALADRIYQTLQRRQQLERERRGLY